MCGEGVLIGLGLHTVLHRSRYGRTLCSGYNGFIVNCQLHPTLNLYDSDQAEENPDGFV